MADVSTQKVSTLELEVELGVEARRLWLAHLDAATSLPIASGGVVESVEYENGNGEVGSVKIVKFGPGEETVVGTWDKLQLFSASGQ